jgi:hypothetical protein
MNGEMVMNRVMLFVGGACIGGALMYALDPNSGSKRRAVAKKKALSAWHSSQDAAQKAREVAQRASGAAAHGRDFLRARTIAIDPPSLRKKERASALQTARRLTGSRAAMNAVAGVLGGIFAAYWLFREQPWLAATGVAGAGYLTRSRSHDGARVEEAIQS